MDMYSEDGFFKEFYHEVVDIERYYNNIEDFDLADTDYKRFKFVSQLQTVKEKIFYLDNEQCNKNIKTAIQLKTKGNSAFQSNNWTAALDIYNAALMITPTANVEDFAILLANRSAVLYHLKEYKLAIKDIEMATKNYPKDKMYKIKERSAKCYLSIGDFHNSLNGFKEFIHCLRDSLLPNDKRDKCEKEAQIMIKNLQAKLENIDESSSKKSIKKCADDDIIRQLNDSVGFDYNVVDGHYAKANNDIKIGESILIEKPHCAVLMEEYCKTHCQHCFLRTIAPIVCPNCPNVIFCSNECRDVALSSYHKYECKILPLFWRSGVSINGHMALRIISQRSLQYFIDIKDQLNDHLKFEDLLRLSPDDYRNVFALVRHENNHSTEDFLQFSIMANFLVYCLQQGNYFSSMVTNNYDQVSEVYSFIGGLILRNLQLLPYNTHEIYELRRSKTSEALMIGSGIYPTYARFNHSCKLSIVRYYKGTSVYVHALTNFKSGEIIPDSYGPVYNQNPYVERQEILKELFHFDCVCEACTEFWPLFNDMQTTKYRFKYKCGNTNCQNILITPSNRNNSMPMVKCKKCNQFTNMFKGTTAVEKIDMLVNNGQHLVERGEYSKAAEAYLEILRIMEKFLKLPFRDYLMIQKAYCNCLMEYGNKNVYFEE